MSDHRSILSASCPMPKLDFEIITMGHGSGGLLTHKLLDAGVFDLLSNEFLDKQHDGAIVDVSAGKMAFTTDSYVVSPIFFPGGNIGELAINGTVNDLCMCGAKAEFISLSFIIEEGLPVKDFWEILIHIKQACDLAGVKVVTGDTKVVERGKGDKIFINTSGIGKVLPDASIDLDRVKPGDKVIISNDIAKHGIAIMSVREGLEFESDIVSDTCHFNAIVPELISRFGEDIHFLRDATRGGLSTILNEVAQSLNKGITIHQKAITVDESVSGACELLGLDPLYVANEGVFVAFVKNSIADHVVDKIRAWKNGSHAAVIGEVTERHPGQVVLHSEIGGRRVVNMLLGEQLPRIC
ncbi:hydrogenase expression/formation protein HypE [Pararhodonellum marinum]|uniref:hydrogenase expression/formation protein HypE n=1 Tax=Pararhodonellum marinum TaxID=2755358 RepID=UPI001E4EB2D8|nr:hydrogenase expression/formation protein HypE [Pararhodonellum marinum]